MDKFYLLVMNPLLGAFGFFLSNDSGHYIPIDLISFL